MEYVDFYNFERISLNKGFILIENQKQDCVIL